MSLYPRRLRLSLFRRSDRPIFRFQIPDTGEFFHKYFFRFMLDRINTDIGIKHIYVIA